MLQHLQEGGEYVDDAHRVTTPATFELTMMHKLLVSLSPRHNLTPSEN